MKKKPLIAIRFFGFILLLYSSYKPKAHQNGQTVHYNSSPASKPKSASIAELIALGDSQSFLFLQRPNVVAAFSSLRLPYVRKLAISCSAVSGDSRVSLGEVFAVDNVGGGGGSGGGGRRGGGGRGSGGGGGSEEEGDRKKSGMSMSQKLTLAYAAFVGVGGVMGYMKSGSGKSLLAGGLSAAALCYVYTQLPSNPVFASSVGLGVSAALLGVMGSRFKKSGKVFPAGVVSLVSLVMTAGYLHGIIRSTH